MIEKIRAWWKRTKARAQRMQDDLNREDKAELDRLIAERRRRGPAKKK